MEILLDIVDKAEAAIRANTVETVLATVIIAGLALLIGLWSLLRRRGIRSLRRRFADMERRLRALEIAAERRIIDQIRSTPSRVPDDLTER